MRRNWSIFGLFALIFGLVVGISAPVRAEFFGCNNDRGKVLASWTVGSGTARHSYSGSRRAARHAYARYTHEYSAQSSRRPRIIVTPRTLRPSAKRYCRSWLVKEYRASGPVIVPRMHCSWG